jgi:hypothetical protein
MRDGTRKAMVPTTAKAQPAVSRTERVEPLALGLAMTTPNRAAQSR